MPTPVFDTSKMDFLRCSDGYCRFVDHAQKLALHGFEDEDAAREFANRMRDTYQTRNMAAVRYRQLFPQP